MECLFGKNQIWYTFGPVLSIRHKSRILQTDTFPVRKSKMLKKMESAQVFDGQVNKLTLKN